MEKYVDMKSPFTGGRVKEISTTEEKEFRKEKYQVHVRYYLCEDTGEQFTTTEQDTLQFNDLYAQYRLRHGIPFPDEIKDIRIGYGLNFSQISRILGFGVNQYAKYESGEMPSESNGKMISAIRDKDIMLNLLKNSRSSFQYNEYDRVLTSILKNNQQEDEFAPIYKIVYSDDKRSVYNGYGRKSIPKLFNMVGRIVKTHGEIFPTKLNKLMFYCDFYHYRRFGQSISGLSYRALNFGPVPNHYATIYDNVPELERKLIEAHGMFGTLLSFSGNIHDALLSDEEKQTIRYVVESLRPLSVSDIIRASHNEESWIRNSHTCSSISYDEAFRLKLI